MAEERWTIGTLKEYADKVFEEHEIRYGQRFEAQERAVLKADAATEKRFESVNEFRATLTEQQRNLLLRSEYDRAHTDLVHTVDNINKGLSNSIAQLNSRMDKKDGERTGSQDVRGWIFGAAGIAIGVVGLIFALIKH